MTYSFSYLEPVCCSMSSSKCCLLTCVQVSQEAGQVIWYSHLFQNFPQFIVIHTVKSFGVGSVKGCVALEWWLHFAGAAIPHVQSKRNPSKTVGTERGHQRADRLKPQTQKYSQSDPWTTALSKSMKLSHACGATPDGRVMVERSDRMRSTKGGNGKPLQYSCLENPMNSMKRQKDRTL